MSNTPSGHQPPNSDPNQNANSPSLGSLLETAERLIKNDGFIDWLSRHVVLGNLIFTVLATYSGVSIVERVYPRSIDPNVVSKNEVCRKQLSTADSSTTSPSVLTVPQGLQATNLLFGCSYITQAGEKLPNIYMQLRPIPESYLVGNKYQEEPITKEAMEGLCRNPDFYVPKLEEQGFKQNEFNFLEQGLELNEKATNVYPVFRLACKYGVTRTSQGDIQNEPDNSGSNFGGGVVSEAKTGIRMDEDYCQRFFSDRNLTKATYHDYNDPESWFCTNPDFNKN
jgi:hypothetical protein